MADRTLTINHADGGSETYTINRDKFAGVRNMSRAVTLPLTDDTTSIQVTVPNKPEFNGVYNTTAPVTGNSTWTRVGGGITITACNFNETDGYDYAIGDDETWGCFDGANGSDRPWKISTIYWTITGIAGTETITVDHTAVPKQQSKETTFGGSQSITVKRDIEPLLSKVVGGASAAYSLRDLNDKAGNNKVVRVRRASDNHERDFLAKEVSNGTLQNWVNTQVVAPLDIKALTSTGRDGAYQIAKAAYSLRSLGTRQATLAATGDTVARADGKFVVQVRRSADDALKSFTADEVTDGTLVDFVSFSVGTAVNGTGGYNHYTLTNASNTGFSADNGDGGASMAGFPYSFTNGDEITVQFTVSNFNNTGGDPHLMGTDSTGTGSQKTNYEFITANGTYTKTLTATADGTHLMFRHFGTGSYTISDFQVPSPTVTKDGFVKTWYDQSVTNEAGDTATGNHAVQATAASQPKIVSAGALNTSGGLEFDGSNDFFSLTSDISFENKAGCVFSVQDGQDSSNDLTLGNSSSNRGIGFRNIQTKWYYTTGAIDIDNSSSTSGLTLFTALHDGTTNDPNVKAFVNSSLIVDGIPDANQGEANVSTVANQIAARRDLSFIEGTVKEIVIYDTDQTNNRTAIEANIGEAHSITGIPAYDDTVDGFVETWYDQSGNSSDATQLTAGSQPKIVDAGSLVTGGIDFLDGTDTFLETTNSDICNVPQLSLFTVLTPHIAASQAVAFSCGAVVSNSTSYGGWVLTLNGYSDTVGLITQSKGNSALTGIFTSVTSSEALVSLVSTFPNASISRDGGTAAASSSMVSPNQTSTGTRKFRIGCNFTFRAASFYTQPINEIIIYTSDQSANRPAIEANINNQYDIY